MCIFVKVQIGWVLLDFFNLLVMLLTYLYFVHVYEVR
jgi:hypothetical protein